jgi:cytochrome c-type protein NapC
MIGPEALDFLLIGTSIAFIAPVVFRPSITATQEGKILAFLAFFIMPIAAVAVGTTEHFERSKQTKFCLSCHIMEPYGKSLYIDDSAYLPAAHFQNHRVPPNEACYTCHTDYALFGTIRVKLAGMKHLYVYYLETPKQPIHLYRPYNNRECLHCHGGARSFESSPTHMAMMDDLKANRLSCISSGCHDNVHNIATLPEQKFWKPEEKRSAE